MGVIRFLLALAVVYGHAAGASIIAPYTPTFGYFPIDPVTAVQMFFVISGFYMSLVLTEKYRALDGWLWKFYLNRYSRLMPSYLIVMAVSTLLVNPQIFSLSDDVWQNVAFKFSAITLFGIDLTAFYDVRGAQALYPAHTQLPVTQAWSIGIEIWFYALVPLIALMSTRVLIAAASVILAARIVVDGFDPSGFPWLQRAWPLEMYFFLLGIFSHRFYQSIRGRLEEKQRPESILALITIVVMVMFAGWLSGMQAWKHHHALLVTSALAAMLPLIFSLTKDWTIDRWIGEFSYPIYLVHLLSMGIPGVRDGFWSYILMSVVCAIPLVVFVEIPVDRWRQRFFRSPSPEGLALRDAKAT